ncbi:MAG: hypothetical protein ACKVQS_12915 [Fimbriimonadaceae bacterium]
MLRFKLLRRICLLSIVLVTCIATPQAAGLAGGPSFKTQRIGEIKLQFRQTSTDSALDSSYVKNFQAHYGLTSNIEIAMDNDLKGNTRFGVKFGMVIDKKQKVRFGLGIQDVFDDSLVNFGLVKDFSDFELHTGYIDNSKGQAFFGYRRKFSKDIRLSLDHSTGPSGRTTSRIDYFFLDGWSLDVRAYFPNNNSKPRTHRFGISYQTNLKQK